ncbi:MAG: hypothetical protein Q8933_00990 [Bacteroidota bacterium]|nr:hypothetical protein [Bacteroidota bacterium]MDP4189979.1 hypothetical protein [Bacteroidota bacterium]MDP4193411.1 hypothetical protein [Bacteroidota bacterium]
MNNWLKERLDYELEQLKKDLKLIALKQKDEEWKRDHYRYTFTLSVQRIYSLLNSTITSQPIAPLSKATKQELTILKELIDKIIKNSTD